jgi:hypothetical protein
MGRNAPPSHYMMHFKMIADRAEGQSMTPPPSENYVEQPQRQSAFTNTTDDGPNMKAKL